MPLEYIPAPDDRRLDPYRELKRGSATARAGLFIAEGEKLAERLLASSYETVSLLVGEKFLPRWSPAAESVRVLVIRDEWVDALVGYNFHRGVLACGRRPDRATLASLDLGDAKSSRPTTLVVCPDVQDPENLGGILRLSAALGLNGVLLGPHCADYLSRRVLRVSMGAAFQVPIAVSRDLPADLGVLQREQGFEAWASVLDPDATPLGAAVRPPRLALLMGSEGHGLSPEVVALCDRRVTIPMRPGVDSLNVTVAAGILLYGLTQSGA